jgi:tyrosyl-tRNA synthetase
MDGKIRDLLDRGVVNIIPASQKLEEVFKSDRKLNVYFGIDPTATKIHIGNAVPLRKLQAFVELGHNITFLIGDFTALIGDTSDKDTERPVLTYEQIQENFKTYKEQAEKIVDFSKVKVVHNSEWLKNLKFEDIVKLCQHFSFGDFASRELIRARLDAGKPVGLHEALYPVMQGYDSYHLDTDIQIGGADQTFNMQAGRTLLKDLSNKESFVIVTGYLEGTDGRKMSKSWGNAIWLTDEPADMFGKVMSIKDSLIIQYFTLATNLPMGEIEIYKQELKSGKNPMEIKLVLAEKIVEELHNEQAAKAARERFERTFQEKQPEYSEELVVSRDTNIAEVVAKLIGSKSEAKRLINQRGVDINETPVDDLSLIVKDDDKIKIGKRRFVKAKINENS